MGIRLRDMICLIRACKTAAEERAVIAKECALLRDAFKEDHQDYRHRNVAKLMFIHMLGFPTHFGQMECIKLIAAVSFPEKRIGYLGLMLLLDERQEVLLLVTNSLKNDINNSNQFITGLALCALGNICTAEMARDLASDVEHLLQSNNAYIRKKAALCAVRIVRKVPDLIESFIDPAIRLLGDKHHGVLISGVKLCIELCQASDVALEQFRKVATNTEGNKNAGHAILYECVQTIMAIEAIGGLRVLAINILGRFLAFPDNNIRYVALNTLVKVVSIDTQAVQRHRATIVECVKDSDISIRRRALDLVYNLVNENNVKVLTKELVEYLKVSDPEFKLDLTAKIAALVQKFSPSQRWYFDQMILLMVQAGQFVAEGVTRFLVIVISNASELQGYVVRTLYRSFQDWRGQESLAQVTVWCIGEYGDLLVNHSNELQGEDPQTITESDAVDVVETILKDVRVTPITQAFALTALLKLSSRFPQCTERIKALLSGYKRSHILELQQRSNEFESIITRHSSISASLLERMPPLDVDGSSSAMEADAGVYTNHTNLQQPSEALSPKNMNSSAQAEEFTVNLLDVLSFQPIENPLSPPVSAGDALLNLLGSSLTSPSNVTMFPGFLHLTKPPMIKTWATLQCQFNQNLLVYFLQLWHCKQMASR
ncbi:hypothetical protein BDL97_09G068400 [Sphagnum fallax]|nr:hypothetical protein BDL97_09G068400 [Sphagnum fallax]KAH8952117.1 hypothetical protein BDL97_09G068400 [Sphagnum fallax]